MTPLTHRSNFYKNATQLPGASEVLATRRSVCNEELSIAYFEAEVLTQTDYYSFGADAPALTALRHGGRRAEGYYANEILLNDKYYNEARSKELIYGEQGLINQYLNPPGRTIDYTPSDGSVITHEFGYDLGIRFESHAGTGITTSNSVNQTPTPRDLKAIISNANQAGAIKKEP